jgi:exodeoxyribonuclease VII small subunit
MSKKTTYSESIKEIENILAQLENDNLDVDTLTEKIQRAAELIKICKEKLLKTDSEIQKILDDMES